MAYSSSAQCGEKQRKPIYRGVCCTKCRCDGLCSCSSSEKDLLDLSYEQSPNIRCGGFTQHILMAVHLVTTHPHAHYHLGPATALRPAAETEAEVDAGGTKREKFRVEEKEG
jgi:hypothetical protein